LMARQRKWSKRVIKHLLEQDDGCCHYCGAELVFLTANEPVEDTEGNEHTYLGIESHTPRLVVKTVIQTGESRLLRYPENVDMFTVDHKVCQADGGTHDLENLVAACFRCNATKHARYDYETFKRLKTEGATLS
jgi:hypothetical protein